MEERAGRIVVILACRIQNSGEDLFDEQELLRRGQRLEDGPGLVHGLRRGIACGGFILINEGQQLRQARRCRQCPAFAGLI